MYAIDFMTVALDKLNFGITASATLVPASNQSVVSMVNNVRLLTLGALCSGCEMADPVKKALILCLKIA